MVARRRRRDDPHVPQIFVRCTRRQDLTVEELRSWLRRRRGAATTVRLTVAGPQAASLLLEVEADDAGAVDDLVTDLRLLGLGPAVVEPRR